MPDPSDPTPERRLTPTERAHELAMAIATKVPSAARGAETLELGQTYTGPKAGQWYCKSISPIAHEGETLGDVWTRTLELAGQVQRDLVALNARIVADELAATLERSRGDAGEPGGAK